MVHFLERQYYFLTIFDTNVCANYAVLKPKCASYIYV